MVLDQKTNFLILLGKTKKTKKQHLLGNYMAKLQKDCFFWFSLRKKLVFRWKNQLLPRKKMVLDQKTNFFLGKRWFWTKKTIFS